MSKEKEKIEINQKIVTRCQGQMLGLNTLLRIAHDFKFTFPNTEEQYPYFSEEGYMGSVAVFTAISSPAFYRKFRGVDTEFQEMLPETYLEENRKSMETVYKEEFGILSNENGFFDLNRGNILGPNFETLGRVSQIEKAKKEGTELPPTLEKTVNDWAKEVGNDSIDAFAPFFSFLTNIDDQFYALNAEDGQYKEISPEEAMRIEQSLRDFSIEISSAKEFSDFFEGKKTVQETFEKIKEMAQKAIKVERGEDFFYIKPIVMGFCNYLIEPSNEGIQLKGLERGGLHIEYSSALSPCGQLKEAKEAKDEELRLQDNLQNNLQKCLNFKQYFAKKIEDSVEKEQSNLDRLVEIYRRGTEFENYGLSEEDKNNLEWRKAGEKAVCLLEMTSEQRTLFDRYYLMCQVEYELKKEGKPEERMHMAGEVLLGQEKFFKGDSKFVEMMNWIVHELLGISVTKSYGFFKEASGWASPRENELGESPPVLK